MEGELLRLGLPGCTRLATRRALDEPGVEGALLRALLLGAHRDAKPLEGLAAIAPELKVRPEVIDHHEHVVLA